MANPRKISNCRSCGARIVWCVNEKGHRQPIDADPVAGGNIRIIPNFIPNCRIQPQLELFDDEDDQLRYMPHHATCPDAEEWRKAYATASTSSAAPA